MRTGARVLIVHSAVTGITDSLERLLDSAVGQGHEEELRAIEERHRRLAAEIGVPPGDEVERHLAELREIAAGIALVREVSDRTRARVLAMGELMATRIGASFPRRTRPRGQLGGRARHAARRRGAGTELGEGERAGSAVCSFLRLTRRSRRRLAAPWHP